MRLRPVLLWLASFLLAGCATLEMPKALPFAKKDPWKGKHGDPVKMVAVWSDAIYNEAGKPPIRGFGGRLYFYDKNEKTVPVEGQLIVYGFDDSCDGAPGPTTRTQVCLHRRAVQQTLHAGRIGRVLQHLGALGASRRLQEDSQSVAGIHVDQRNRSYGPADRELAAGQDARSGRTGCPPPDHHGDSRIAGSATGQL